MIERFGTKGTEVDGIFFTEGSLQGAQHLGKLQVESRKQNVPLDELKRKLAGMAKAKGANAIAEFHYVQQATVFSFSSTRWRVSGDAVFASD